MLIVAESHPGKSRTALYCGNTGNRTPDIAAMTNAQNICPLCGQLNQCAQAGSTVAVESCWCFAKKIDPRILEQIPAGIDRSCICPRCAMALPIEPEPAVSEPKR